MIKDIIDESAEEIVMYCLAEKIVREQNIEVAKIFGITPEQAKELDVLNKIFGILEEDRNKCGFIKKFWNGLKRLVIKAPKIGHE